MPDLLGDISYQWPFYAALVLAYLLGSIPFGLILTKLAGLGDIRQIGSGSIGATNVLRTGNKALALAVTLLDGGKGAVAVLIAWRFGPDMAVFAAAGAVLGHCFPGMAALQGRQGRGDHARRADGAGFCDCCHRLCHLVGHSRPVPHVLCRRNVCGDRRPNRSAFR